MRIVKWIPRIKGVNLIKDPLIESHLLFHCFNLQVLTPVQVMSVSACPVALLPCPQPQLALSVSIDLRFFPELFEGTAF